MRGDSRNYWLTEFNFMPEVTKDLFMPKKVNFYDVTLREVDQTPGAVLRADEKISMAMELDKLGVDYIEIFPIVSKEDAYALTEITKMPKQRGLKTSGLARCVKSDIDAVAETGCKHVMIEGPANMFYGPRLMKANTEDELVKLFVDAVKYAKSLGMKVASEPWDCGKSTLPLLEKLYTSIVEAGVEELIYADTFNNSTPWTIFYLVRKMREWVGKDVELGVHFHNDFGLATANALAGVAAGATIVHTAINNAGERTGNIALEEVAVALELLMGVETDIDLTKLYPVAKKFEAISKLPISDAKPILGRRSFLIGSGLNVDMYDKMNEEERTKFFPYAPALVGQPPAEVCWGKGCGRNMVLHQAQRLGITLTKEQANAVRDKVKEESMIRKALLEEHEVNLMIQEYAGQQGT